MADALVLPPNFAPPAFRVNLRLCCTSIIHQATVKKMFKAFKIILGAFLFLLLAFLALYFLPGEIKEKTLASLAGIVPETLKEKAEELLLRPPEKRLRVIKKLETEIKELKAGPEKKTATEDFIKEAEELIAELKAKNEDASLTSALTARLVEKLLDREKVMEGNRCVN